MTSEVLNIKLNGLGQEVSRLSLASLKKHEADIIKKNQEQLTSGVGINGKKLQTGYKPTQRRKREKAGLQTAFVDLKFNGEYQGGLTIEMDETGAKIFSNDWKESYLVNEEPLLEHHWGEILGLTEKNMKWLLDEVTSDLYNGLLTYFS
jgi:hypothetical protein